MFENARVKLTAWYLLIIMLISVSFSTVIYRGLNTELARLERIEQVRILRRQPEILFNEPGLPPTLFDPDVVEETRKRILLFLVGVNTLILAGSAVAGYFLAGRTLQPIADMVDQQNRFITDASHELRTPLTALKSEIEVNLRNTKLTLTDSKRLLQSNLEEVNNLQALSDNLMLLTGNNNVEMSSVKLPAVITDAVRKVSVAAKTKHMNITSNVPALTVYGNQMLLTELFIILLDNAIKYSPRGKRIALSAKKTDGHAIVTVTDEGYGIHEEDIPHLFDRFWRADKSRTKTQTPGYGLGLAIAKQITDRHHGTIHVESRKGKGSTFTVILPV